MRKFMLLVLFVTFSTANAKSISQALRTCLNDNKSSGWHIIANENICYTQEYQRQIKKTHRLIKKIYQQILALPMHKNKQATGSLSQMDTAWQKYRDNKCRLFQALELPFHRTQQSDCERETTKNYLVEQQKFLQELKRTLADDKKLMQ